MLQIAIIVLLLINSVYGKLSNIITDPSFHHTSLINGQNPYWHQDTQLYYDDGIIPHQLDAQIICSNIYANRQKHHCKNINRSSNNNNWTLQFDSNSIPTSDQYYKVTTVYQDISLPTKMISGTLEYDFKSVYVPHEYSDSHNCISNNVWLSAYLGDRMLNKITTSHIGYTIDHTIRISVNITDDLEFFKDFSTFSLKYYCKPVNNCVCPSFYVSNVSLNIDYNGTLHKENDYSVDRWNWESFMMFGLITIVLFIIYASSRYFISYTTR